MAPIISRSCVSRYLATSQPPPGWPTRLCFSTRTLSKKVSQKGDLPEISVIGFVLTPGLAMSKSTKLMPVCFFAALSVRTRQKIQSAWSA